MRAGLRHKSSVVLPRAVEIAKRREAPSRRARAQHVGDSRAAGDVTFQLSREYRSLGE
jgi:hypothetical protein